MKDLWTEYELIEPIGRGGQGEIWKGRTCEENTLVAIKLLRPQATFLHDLLPLHLQLIHPHIVRPLAFHLDRVPPFIVFEYIEGKSLAEVLSQNPPPWPLEEIGQLFGPLLRALEYAHSLGVHHLDLKPSNILLSSTGQLKVTDFSLTLPEPPLHHSLSTSSGAFLSYGYSAPELWNPPEGDRKDFSLPQSDIFSLGVLLYQLLTGQLPQGLSLPSQLRPNLDKGWDSLLQRCLSLRPQERPSTVAQLRKELEPLLPLAPTPEPYWISIDEGPFLKGDPPQKTSLPPFWISQFLVTCAEYFQFCLQTSHPLPSSLKRRRGNLYPYEEPYLPPQWENLPIVNISFQDAQAYAHWRDAELPTEEEWEKAARGTDGRTYPWGNSWEPHRLHWQGNQPVSVYSYPDGDSPYGVRQMAGNVWEWCLDRHSSGARGIRGGSFRSSPEYFRCANGSFLLEHEGAPDVGFRVVRRKP